MTSITFAVSKGGVGKSLITANVSAALAAKGQKVVLVEGDPNQPLQKILGVGISSGSKLEDVVRKDENIEEAVYPTTFDRLFLIPSGVSLQSYFDIDPITYARKLQDLRTDFTFIDVPFPLGKAAFLSLGVCEYFIPILTEDEFVLCVESSIDTIRLGKYFLKSVPVGFVLNRVQKLTRFNKEFVKDLENLLEIPCITRIKEDPKARKSYGEVGSRKAFLPYDRFKGSDFAKSIDEIADFLLQEVPAPKRKEVIQLLQQVTKPIRKRESSI